MAHTLTFNYDDPSSGYTVRKGSISGEYVHSPYTLQNGDELYFQTVKINNTINGTSYSSSDLENTTLEFVDVDINIVGASGPQLGITPFVLKYTESGGGSTVKFKHFFDAGLQGTGTYKFRHYSQQEPSTGNVIKAGTYRWKDNAVTYPGDFDYVSGSAYDTYKEFFNFISGPYGDTTQYYGFLFRKYPGGYLRMEYMTNLTGSTNGESGMSWSNSTSTTSPGYIDYEFIVIGDDVNVSDLLASWFNSNTESYTDIKAGNYLISENPTLPDEELTNFDNATCKMYTMTADNTFGPLTEATLFVNSESITVSSELETGDSINYSLSDGWMYILNEGTFTATDTTKMRTLTEFSGCYCTESEKAWFTANTTKLS